MWGVPSTDEESAQDFNSVGGEESDDEVIYLPGEPTEEESANPAEEGNNEDGGGRNFLRGLAAAAEIEPLQVTGTARGAPPQTGVTPRSGTGTRVTPPEGASPPTGNIQGAPAQAGVTPQTGVAPPAGNVQEVAPSGGAGAASSVTSAEVAPSGGAGAAPSVTGAGVTPQSGPEVAPLAVPNSGGGSAGDGQRAPPRDLISFLQTMSPDTWAAYNAYQARTIAPATRALLQSSTSDNAQVSGEPPFTQLD